MKILIGHNRYREPGGEDAVMEADSRSLRDAGEEVVLYERSNLELDADPIPHKLRRLWSMDHSRESYEAVRKLLRKEKPQVAHFYNTFFMMTPAVYAACRDEGVPVVQSLHNFRLLCSNALFYRDGHPCEDCATQGLWAGVRHGCYRESRLITALVVRMLRKHWRRDTWRKQVDLYVTATEFTREKYVRGGIPAEKIRVKPNILYPEPRRQSQDRGYALYVGRLSREKGVDVLIEAWKAISALPLVIVGDGPSATASKRRVEDLKIRNVEFLGYVSRQVLEEKISGAKCVIVPSMCYENFPRIVAEAFAYGVPLIASRLGSLREVIEDGRSGYLFEAGDPEDLARVVNGFLERSERQALMRQHAREVHQRSYTPEKNCATLLEIYRQAIASRR